MSRTCQSFCAQLDWLIRLIVVAVEWSNDRLVEWFVDFFDGPISNVLDLFPCLIDDPVERNLQKAVKPGTKHYTLVDWFADFFDGPISRVLVSVSVFYWRACSTESPQSCQTRRRTFCSSHPKAPVERFRVSIQLVAPLHYITLIHTPSPAVAEKITFCPVVDCCSNALSCFFRPADDRRNGRWHLDDGFLLLSCPACWRTDWFAEYLPSN